MSEDAIDFANTDICVSRDVMRRHYCTKTDDYPLDGFRDCLTLRHGGASETSNLSNYGSTSLTKITPNHQPNRMLTLSHSSNYPENIQAPVICTIEYI